MVHAFVIGRIDYCNSLLYGLPSVYVDKLQRLQNSAAQLITHTPRFHHITPVLKSLPWLPVKFRILFKIAILTFKVLPGRSPDYLKELVTLKDNSDIIFNLTMGFFWKYQGSNEKRHWVIALFQWQTQPYGTSYLKIYTMSQILTVLNHSSRLIFSLSHIILYNSVLVFI